MFELGCHETDLSYTTQACKSNEPVFETDSSCADEGFDGGTPGVVLAIRPMRKTVVEDADLIREKFVCPSRIN